METKGQTAWDPSHSPTTGSWCSRSFPRGIPFLSHKVQSIGKFWHSLLTWSFLKVIKKKDHLKQNNKMEIVPIFSFQNVLMASLNGCSFIFYNWFRISYISDILRLNKYTVWKFTRHQPLLQDPVIQWNFRQLWLPINIEILNNTGLSNASTFKSAKGISWQQ